MTDLIFDGGWGICILHTWPNYIDDVLSCALRYFLYSIDGFTSAGLLIDTARHFFPLSSLRRTMDAMQMVKLNTLHLHLSDAQVRQLRLGFATELLLFQTMQIICSRFFKICYGLSIFDYYGYLWQLYAICMFSVSLICVGGLAS